jgi:biotin carboxyl carrier protein
MGTMTVTRVGDGVYRVDVEHDGTLVYVAGPVTDRWVFCDGRVYRADFSDMSRGSRRASRGHAAQAIVAPMPATVLKVLVAPAQVVKKGDTVVVLEAMKMELPMRAAGDGTVRAVRCREGELVDADAVLVEFD